MAKILIADDSKTFRMGLRICLESANHDVVEACDGADAIQKAMATDGLELIFLDINMPVMDGITAARKIHETQGLEKIPIFMLTTEITQELKLAAKQAGVMCWLVKPYKRETILDLVKKVTLR